MIEYIFFYKDIVVGGCELLIEKVSKQMVKEGIRTKILCKTIDGSMMERFDSSGVEIHRLTDWESNKELRSYISIENEIRMITFFWEDFVRVYFLKKRKMKTILYAVHFQVLALGANCRYPLLKKIIKAVGGKSIYEFMFSKKILCMDEQTVRHTQNYFKKTFLEDTSMCRIVRVPINIADVDKRQLEIRAGNKEFHVLTIARAEFPFKGYMLGLIDFIENQEDKNNLHLDIISYGPDIDKLKNKIDALDEETKKVITLHGKTDYDALSQYYDNTKLYIGMGTTILDAAQRGIISIPILFYTEELVADKFFHEDYRVLAVDEGTTNHILNLWETARGLSREQYLELSEKTRKIAIENYGIEKTTGEILSIFEKIKDDKLNLKIFMFKWLGIIQQLLHKT